MAEQRATQVLLQTRQCTNTASASPSSPTTSRTSPASFHASVNAEVYVDNPEFQRDMLATVRASVGKITRRCPACRPNGRNASTP